MTTPTSVQLQGGFATWPGLCPWIPLGAQPPDPHYRLALAIMAPNLYSWIRPWLATIVCFFFGWQFSVVFYIF